jgi:hypothetical protein
MHLYQIHDDPEDLTWHPEDKQWIHIWHHNQEEAAELARSYFGVRDVSVPKVLQSPEGPEKAEPHAECRDGLLREMGCSYPGDSSCDTCGLYEMDGKYPVCEGCYQCEECGCSCSEEGS